MKEQFLEQATEMGVPKHLTYLMRTVHDIHMGTEQLDNTYRIFNVGKASDRAIFSL